MVLHGTRQCLPRDNAKIAVVVEAELEVLGAQKDERFNPGRKPRVVHARLQPALQDLALKSTHLRADPSSVSRPPEGSGTSRQCCPRTGLARPSFRPGTGRIAHDERVDLEQPTRARVEEVEELPHVERVVVGRISSMARNPSRSWACGVSPMRSIRDACSIAQLAPTTAVRSSGAHPPTQ